MRNQISTWSDKNNKTKQRQRTKNNENRWIAMDFNGTDLSISERHCRLNFFRTTNGCRLKWSMFNDDMPNIWLSSVSSVISTIKNSVLFYTTHWNNTWTDKRTQTHRARENYRDETYERKKNETKNQVDTLIIIQEYVVEDENELKISFWLFVLFDRYFFISSQWRCNRCFWWKRTDLT